LSPCRRQLPATLVAIALATKAIDFFVALHLCHQRSSPATLIPFAIALPPSPFSSHALIAS
jgi:hypothetical protein